mmetsp:Transcript_36600/g.36204  ORF Transcript_36600/g.36204 Transcript_36600/m.36204 type:complete len:140 (+) Transcript_36600:28-447(+)
MQLCRKTRMNRMVEPYDMYAQKKFVETKEMIDLDHVREERSFTFKKKNQSQCRYANKSSRSSERDFSYQKDNNNGSRQATLDGLLHLHDDTTKHELTKYHEGDDTNMDAPSDTRVSRVLREAHHDSRLCFKRQKRRGHK